MKQSERRAAGDHQQIEAVVEQNARFGNQALERGEVLRLIASAEAGGIHGKGYCCSHRRDNDEKRK